jgi:hypothetical protein
MKRTIKSLQIMVAGAAQPGMLHHYFVGSVIESIEETPQGFWVNHHDGTSRFYGSARVWMATGTLSDEPSEDLHRAFPEDAR